MMKWLLMGLGIFLLPSIASAAVVGDRLDTQKRAIAGDIITDKIDIDALLSQLQQIRQGENEPALIGAGYWWPDNRAGVPRFNRPLRVRPLSLIRRH